MLKLINDDIANVLPNIKTESIDLCLTDLPYGILSQKKTADYQNKNRNFCDWDFEIDYDKVLPELRRVMKPDGAIVLFAKAPFTYRLYEQMIKYKFKHRYNWIWKKTSAPNFASLKFVPKNDYEEVMVFSKSTKGLKYYPGALFTGETKTKCCFYNSKTREPISSEEVFDNYIIPLTHVPDDIYIPCGESTKVANSTSSNNGIHLNSVLDLEVFSNVSQQKTPKDNAGMSSGIKLTAILNDRI